MLDDVRQHDPRPSDEELAWMSFDPLAAAARVAAALVLAVALGGYVTYSLESPQLPASVAKR
ncbi:MAG TPA: hypothetical protein VHP55_01715 [Usitatibacter sp.]|jgi:uncharacterized membrane protein YraQ (UPF0718 family)|nr:hypothetical protein [Usitatibacter sp.]